MSRNSCPWKFDILEISKFAFISAINSFSMSPRWMRGDNNNKGGNEFNIVASFPTRAKRRVVVLKRLEVVDISVWSKRGHCLKKAEKLTRAWCSHLN